MLIKSSLNNIYYLFSVLFKRGRVSCRRIGRSMNLRNMPRLYLLFLVLGLRLGVAEVDVA
jgi:hypothetical protein